MATTPLTTRTDGKALIPDRLYFKIGDVATICGVAPSVLRFWESQFPQLKPNKSGTGQRLFRRRDVELALEIKRLVHEEGFTLAGARQAMGAKPATGAGERGTLRMHRRVMAQEHKSEWQPELPMELDRSTQREKNARVVAEIRTELRAMLMELSSPVGAAGTIEFPAQKQEESEEEAPEQLGFAFA